MEKPVVFYVYDALCGWCYGFSPVMKQFYERHRDVCEFQTVSGGMVRGDRIGPIGEVAPYIKDAYKRVEEYSGVRFGEPFLNGILNEGSAIFTSEPAAIAMAVFRTHLSDRTVEFAHALQQAVYRDGIRPAEYESYGAYAAQFGLNADDFVAQMRQPAMAEAARQDYQLAAQLGVNGFPTVILLRNDTLYTLTRGFAPLETLEAAFQKALR